MSHKVQGEVANTNIVSIFVGYKEVYETSNQAGHCNFAWNSALERYEKLCWDHTVWGSRVCILLKKAAVA